MKFYDFFKLLAFNLDPEKAHNLSISMLSKYPLAFSELFGTGLDNGDKYKTKLNGMDWSFPIGLAAGLDKNAEAIDFFSRLLFGAIEVGTVTPLPQAGNDKPRMFRYVEEESLRNRMGFNNAGSEVILNNVLNSIRNNKVLGVNLGKNKVTPAEQAPDDYQKLYRKFAETSDYLVVNVSSPNTPGLRDLQNVNSLREIFDALIDLRKETPCPLYLKISPDLAFEDLDGIIQMAEDYKLSGLIGTNTTIMKDRGDGGISGALLKERARDMRSEVLKRIDPGSDLDFIGVGGVNSFQELMEFWKLGGRAMQIYTGFIYKGPSVLTEIKLEIDSLLGKYQFSNLEECLNNIDKVKA